MNPELQALIEQAISQEELSHAFYKRLAELVSHKETKETLHLNTNEKTVFKIK